MHPISRSLTQKIERFAKLMIESQEFSEISDFFHEELVPLEEFMAVSVPRKNRRLATFLRMLFRATRGSSELRYSYLSTIEAARFWHGTLAPGAGGLALVYYCEDVNRGLLCYTTSLADQRVQFIRFYVPEDLTGTEDPELTSLTHMSRRPAGGYLQS